ncbi:MAG: FAD:protein FMN transferase [Candidatus Velamenicoccus archaeovorus]
MDPRRHHFRAMGTSVSLIADPRSRPDAFARAARAVELTFVREEFRFSRFRGDSELARVNARAGRWTKVSPGFATLLAYALDAAASSDGLFDPTVLPALVAAGYDRDFDELIAGARDALHPSEPCGRWPDVELDGDLVRLPVGVGLDFGGIAKGWTVDLAAHDAVGQGLPWAIVNAGGDLRIAGSPPLDGFPIGIDDPEVPGAEVLRIRVDRGAVATSSITARAWGPGRHHLIDPRTALPADTGILQATVWAETCAEAEIRSKWALLSGPSSLDHVTGVLVTTDGRVLMNVDGEVATEVPA